MGGARALLVSDELVEKHIQILLGHEHIRLPPSTLIRAVQARLPSSPRGQVRSVIKSMVASGRLAYSCHSGITQMEVSRHGLMRISQRVALYSGQGAVPSQEGVRVIRIGAGVSFGCGDHPTTRLALRGLDVLLLQASHCKPLKAITLLDLGTGSGILAIAAAMLGVKHAVGVDVDPAACHEAIINTNTNGMQQKVTIFCGTPTELTADPFDIVVANLRPPTLFQIMDRIGALTSVQGFWILSGFRPDERTALERSLPRNAQAVWAEDDRGWMATGYHFS